MRAQPFVPQRHFVQAATRALTRALVYSHETEPQGADWSSMDLWTTLNLGAEQAGRGRVPVRACRVRSRHIGSRTRPQLSTRSVIVRAHLGDVTEIIEVSGSKRSG
jgi:hypothetical protein